MMRHTTYLLFFAGLICQATPASGQVQHNHDFTVYVPPAMTLRALRPDQTVIHPETPADITMSNSLWWATTSSSTGSTIRFSTNTAFVNQTRPGYKRDVRLHSPRLFGTPSARWTYDTATDQTDYAAGDEQSVVQISGTRPGVAMIFLQVTFITGNVATLAGGDYEVIVVGTITAN